MKSIRDSFLKEGHVSFKQFLDEDFKSTITEVIYHNFKNELNLRNLSSFNVENEDFHQKLIRFRNNNPSGFRRVYDNIKLNARLRSIFYNDKFLDLFSSVLGISRNLIFLNGIMLRLDAPLDTRNNLDWHQDSSYYMMNYPKFNSGVCWMAVTQNSVDNGTLIYVPQSHSKYIKAVYSKDSKNSSEQALLKPTEDELNRALNLDQEFGDLTMLHMNIKHKSGINSSNKFRITTGCRFHDMTKSFNSGVEYFKYFEPDALEI